MLFKRLTTSLKEALYSIRRIFRVLKNPEQATYYPQEERKSKLGVWADNLMWAAKHREVNIHYFVYGLDRKKGVDRSQFLAYTELRKYRNPRNQQVPGKHYNYVCMLQDKFVFGQFLTSLGFPTPKNIALLDSGQLTWLDSMKKEPLEALVQGPLKNIDGFCKKLQGVQGVGAFPLSVVEGSLCINEEKITLQQLKEKLDGPYLFQERIKQHPKMAQLHPPSINSVRLVTFNNRGNVEVFSSVLRIGARGRNVDNWASGGIIVAIDKDSGKLGKEGTFKKIDGGRVSRHPDTGVVLEGFEIPFFQESVDLVCRLHSYFYGVHSVGWDIGITPDGPILIEGNDDWDAALPMAMEQNFKTRFLQMFSS